jgi:hypothetical protein
MTRTAFHRSLSRLYWLLTIALAILLAAKFLRDIPGVPTGLVSAAGSLYDFARDMSLLIAIGIFAYVANILTKRWRFAESLKAQWRDIAHAKSVLLSVCEKRYLATDDYLAAFHKVSEAIDTMRVVYRNAGETSGLRGLYPYEPLLDMRRALQSLDPRTTGEVTAEQKNLARDAILRAFDALSETLLDELDLVEPERPGLISGARPEKAPGADVAARITRENQQRRLDREPKSRPDIDAMLATQRGGNDTPAGPD